MKRLGLLCPWPSREILESQITELWWPSLCERTVFSLSQATHAFISILTIFGLNSTILCLLFGVYQSLILTPELNEIQGKTTSELTSRSETAFGLTQIECFRLATQIMWWMKHRPVANRVKDIPEPLEDLWQEKSAFAMMTLVMGHSCLSRCPSHHWGCATFCWPNLNLQPLEGTFRSL